jgi:hypothetical protein
VYFLYFGEKCFQSVKFVTHSKTPAKPFSSCTQHEVVTKNCRYGINKEEKKGPFNIKYVILFQSHGNDDEKNTYLHRRGSDLNELFYQRRISEIVLTFNKDMVTFIQGQDSELRI